MSLIKFTPPFDLYLTVTDSGFTDASFSGTPPSYAYDADRAEEQRRHHDMMPYIDDSPSSSPHLSSKSRGSRDTLSSGSLESTKSSEPDLEKGLEMRKWVLSGILASEETYLSHLEALLLPMKPLKAAATTSQPVLTSQQIETIFFKVPELYEIHSFMVELVEGARKLRHVFLFTDLFLCAKLKKQIGGKSQQYDCKWYIPLTDLSFQMVDESEAVPNIPLVPDEELDAMKIKISQIKNDIQREK
ncbi:PREDICTED: breakpoint cluster region protein-like, partial [Fulmarus glacialis]|uniref:breakpoint cluster region protein-like n=1 Tax=Fulmarus glacialis TaxID=30455 RepID=UPI00051B7120